MEIYRDSMSLSGTIDDASGNPDAFSDRAQPERAFPFPGWLLSFLRTKARKIRPW